jgi:FlaA1/EpsC-like NDP-sugar epimerase
VKGAAISSRSLFAFPRSIAFRRAIIAALHLALVPVVYWAAYLLRFDGAVPPEYVTRYWETLPLLLVLRLTAFAVFRQFRGWWRYVGMHDLAALVSALSWSTLLFLAALFLTGQIHEFPRTIVFLDWGVGLLVFGGIRFAVRWLREGRMARGGSGLSKRTLIIGAGDAASQLIRQARLDPMSGIRPVGLVDDNPSKRNIELHGVPVLGTTRDLDRLVVEHRVELLVVAIAAATRDEMRKIAERCTGLNVEFKIVPSLLELMDGKARLSQLRSVSVEDLLGRPSVRLDLHQVDRDLHAKAVLITGAAGSIGSELARQVAAFGPSRLILLEQAESPLFFIEQEIVESHPELEVIPIIADVTDARRIERVFADFRPATVFHAAAYKHVPMMETNLEEAIRNNVMGTFHVARSAVRHQAAKFVLISTDKAVRPSSVMGASKRVAERLVLGWPEFRHSPTDFRAVRFGNVLGSQGSVIPVFRQQIANGGPVTVTHPEMQRYFMTIPEAVQLVLEASALPEAAGRISMLDMGEPMRILEMAENLIRFSGLEPYTQMPIIFTGVRPGEKLQEDLMSEVEQAVPTTAEKVRVVQTDETDEVAIRDGLAALDAALEASDTDQLLDALCVLVPESTAPLCDRGKQASTRVARRPDRLGPVRADGGVPSAEVLRDGTDPPVIWLTR